MRSKQMKTRLLFPPLLAFLSGLFVIPIFAAPQAAPQEIVVEGKVCDNAGSPISGASVQLETESGKAIASTVTDSSGNFRLKMPTDAKVRIHVRQQGFSDNAVTYDNTKMQIILKKSAASNGMEFSDSPNFTVAGVTDWSNVGLHGSDVNVKTSEALTKEATGLKSSSGSAPRDSEADAHRILGDEKEESGDPLDAAHEYELAVKLDASEQNYFSWGAELLLHRAGVAAVEVLSKGATLHATSQRMIEALGAAFYANGQYTEATQQMCRAAELNPDDPEPYLFLGRIEAGAKDTFSCSEEALRRFVSEQPKNADGNFYYGLVLLKNAQRSQREADFQRATSAFRNALASRPSFGEVYVQLGLLYNARGQKDAAFREFQNAVRVAPHLPEAHYQLSLASRRAGDTARADEEMKKYEGLHSAEEAALDKQRKEMKQFVTILQQSPK